MQQIACYEHTDSQLAKYTIVSLKRRIANLENIIFRSCKMTDNELIEVLKEFSKERVENLPTEARKLFDAIMKIADERDKYKKLYETTKEILVANEFKIIDLEKSIEMMRGIDDI